MTILNRGAVCAVISANGCWRPFPPAADPGNISANVEPEVKMLIMCKQGHVLSESNQ